ncbi:transposase family protein [Spiroplasma poulsonii]|uniref:transposase family protein n=1 Tax=Spiroplasma poulsonii TaxID=2138 RepID=UPI001F4CA0C5|nr:transposase family protein [Spiroplasma poulsonii]UNF61340.1 transposase family protein [Spiroplasma poulsonii]
MIILMIKLLLLMLPKTPIQRPKRQKQSYSGKKKHTIKTQVIWLEQETKNYYCNKLQGSKNMIMFLFKESKSRILKIPN